jgi:CHRD domain
MRTSRRSIRAAPSGTRRWGVVRVLPVVVLAAFSVPAALVASGGPASGAGGGTFTSTLTGAQEVPPNASTATGFATVTLNAAETMITVAVVFSGLTTPVSAALIQGPAAPGVNGPLAITLTGFPAATSGSYSQSFTITSAQVSDLRAGLLYVNLHDTTFPGGEIRGQLPAVPPAPPTSVPASGLASVPAPEPVATTPSFTG